jgi:phosphopantothenoylcysteine decarboxylase / phosphopantothenate---cysteine ligase
MPHILITSGPTRQYLDPVRYLSNASSGRMGAALAAAAIEMGHRVTIVSGPVDVEYPAEAEVISVTSTDEMLAACRKVFPDCDGLIAAAAPCDYRPTEVASQKIHKSGGPLRLELVQTPDIVATLADERRSAGPHPNPLPKGEGTCVDKTLPKGEETEQESPRPNPLPEGEGMERRPQWIVGFALETEDAHLRALRKLEQKNCDLVVVNGPDAISAGETRVDVLGKSGEILASLAGSKGQVARGIFRILQQRLIALT